MAIEEHDREDLLRDGRAMPLRAETTIGENTVVIGFRTGGQMSLYCGADPVFQFNKDCQLRRVYYQGQRYAAENGNIVHLQRATKGGRVQFRSQPIHKDQQAAILNDLKMWLSKISGLQPNQWTLADSNKERFFRELHSAFDKLSTAPTLLTIPISNNGQSVSTAS